MPSRRPMLRIANPATGEFLGEVATAGPEEVAAAVARARAAQPAWAALPFRQRARVLGRFHDLLFERRDAILDALQRETGKTRKDAFGELLTVALTAGYYLAHGRAALAEERRRASLPGLTSARVLRRPWGVVGFVTPWNYPFLLAIGDALPALLAGNAVVIKPAEATPLAADLAVELLREAGLAADLAATVHGPGEVTGAALVERADYIAFTGSVATGRRIAGRAGERLVPCSLELGGKNPMIVLAGAPLAAAVEGLMTGAFYNSGQTCIAVERVYVEERIFDRYVELAAERTRRLRLGWSLGWDVDVGSLISTAHAEKVAGHVRDAAAGGARVVVGGGRRPDLGPAFHEPTLLTGVNEAMPVCREETFGPVVSLLPVRDADEAVARANALPYGLNASLWGPGGRTALALARRITAGSVGLSSTLLIYHTLDAPMGGMRQSGLGRRHAREGILRFTQPQSVVGSIAAGGGYEGLLFRIRDARHARWLARLVRLRRHLPGLR